MQKLEFVLLVKIGIDKLMGVDLSFDRLDFCIIGFADKWMECVSAPARVFNGHAVQHGSIALLLVNSSYKLHLTNG